MQKHSNDKDQAEKADTASNSEFNEPLGTGWILTTERLPDEGQEVTIRMMHGQIKQVVKDKNYSGGWKQPNCQGWEHVSWHASTITHWRPEIFDHPTRTGPEDAPWMST